MTLTRAVKVDGISYVPASELARELDVSRQTLWRWRREKKIPAGHRFRNGMIVFSEIEAEAVRRHAQRLEPLDFGALNQLGLFD